MELQSRLSFLPTLMMWWQHGERQCLQYDDPETRLAKSPVIAVPTITMEGDDNGAPDPEPVACAKKFSGKYAHRTINGGIGHNPPQEAPQAFAEAVVDVAAIQ